MVKPSLFVLEDTCRCQKVLAERDSSQRVQRDFSQLARETFAWHKTTLAGF